MRKHSTNHHHLHYYPSQETKETRGLCRSYRRQEEHKSIIFFDNRVVPIVPEHEPIQGPWKDSSVRAAQGPE